MKKDFWTFLQVLSLFLLFGTLPNGYLLRHPGAGCLVLGVLVLLYIGELLVTIPLAKQRRLPTGIVILKTMLFGFTWWVPFKQGLLQG